MRNTKTIGIICIVFVLFLCGCKQKNEVKYIEFKCVKELVGKPNVNIVAYTASRMQVIDTMLIIMNLSKKENIIEVYSTLSNKLLAEFGRLGKGDDLEFVDPYIFNENSSLEPDKSEYYNIIDISRRRISNVNIRAVLSPLKKASANYRIPEQLDFINKLFYQDDSVIIYEGEHEGRFGIYNKHNKEKKIVPYCVPEPGFMIPKDNEYFIYTSKVCVNPTLHLIASAPILLGQLDFFDFNGEHCFTNVFERENNLKEMLQSENVTNTRAKAYIKQLISNSQHIYALNSNLRFTDMKAHNESKINSEILIFDWKGMPVEKILLDRYITNFTIDFVTKKIYAFCPEEWEHNIVEYQL